MARVVLVEKELCPPQQGRYARWTGLLGLVESVVGVVRTAEQVRCSADSSEVGGVIRTDSVIVVRFDQAHQRPGGFIAASALEQDLAKQKLGPERVLLSGDACENLLGIIESTEATERFSFGAARGKQDCVRRPT